MFFPGLCLPNVTTHSPLLHSAAPKKNQACGLSPQSSLLHYVFFLSPQLTMPLGTLHTFAQLLLFLSIPFPLDSVGWKLGTIWGFMRVLFFVPCGGCPDQLAVRIKTRTLKCSAISRGPLLCLCYLMTILCWGWCFCSSHVMSWVKCPPVTPWGGALSIGAQQLGPDHAATAAPHSVAQVLRHTEQVEFIRLKDYGKTYGRKKTHGKTYCQLYSSLTEESKDWKDLNRDWTWKLKKTLVNLASPRPCPILFCWSRKSDSASLRIPLWFQNVIFNS